MLSPHPRGIAVLLRVSRLNLAVVSIVLPTALAPSSTYACTVLAWHEVAGVAQCAMLLAVGRFEGLEAAVGARVFPIAETLDDAVQGGQDGLPVTVRGHLGGERGAPEG